MDQPGLDAGLHRQALAGLGRINRISRTAGIFWRAIRRPGLKSAADAPLRILDLACGGGDVAVGMARLARRDGVEARISGCDISPLAIEVAMENAAAAGLENVKFRRLDVLADDLPGGHDVVTCSLFLHHLDDGQAVELLRRGAAAAGQLLLVNDLRRGPAGWALAWIACRLLTRSPVVHADGPMSISAAFTMPEAADLARRAGLIDARIKRHWPQRYLLTWRRG
jgi:2-polyprenyl-3-methyl-5-hydroxy-6-metoxy-1,4-benzoquinol methylase